MSIHVISRYEKDNEECKQVYSASLRVENVCAPWVWHEWLLVNHSFNALISMLICILSSVMKLWTMSSLQSVGTWCFLHEFLLPRHFLCSKAYKGWNWLLAALFKFTYHTEMAPINADWLTRRDVQCHWKQNIPRILVASLWQSLCFLSSPPACYSLLSEHTFHEGDNIPIK
jgi:hypothetical protein